VSLLIVVDHILDSGARLSRGGAIRCIVLIHGATRCVHCCVTRGVKSGVPSWG
jgi:hypothetical protein